VKYLLLAATLFAAPAAAEINLTVNRTDKTITAYNDGRTVVQHQVAVGKPGSPTPLGGGTITEIHFNPDWAGTRGQGYVPSGPRSPLGRIRMRYDMPYALHGTIKPESIGTEASLGCIRMQNAEIIELARLILKDSGDYKGDAWFDGLLRNPHRQYQIKLSTPVKLRVVQ
jgi:lipoprotein-anchoring transpeptidase ErfK/SrfK